MYAVRKPAPNLRQAEIMVEEEGLYRQSLLKLQHLQQQPPQQQPQQQDHQHHHHYDHHHSPGAPKTPVPLFYPPQPTYYAPTNFDFYPHGQSGDMAQHNAYMQQHGAMQQHGVMQQHLAQQHPMGIGTSPSGIGYYGHYPPPSEYAKSVYTPQSGYNGGISNAHLRTAQYENSGGDQPLYSGYADVKYPIARFADAEPVPVNRIRSKALCSARMARVIPSAALIH